MKEGDFITLKRTNGKDIDDPNYSITTYVGIISYTDSNNVGFKKATSILYYPNKGKQYITEDMSYFSVSKKLLYI